MLGGAWSGTRNLGKAVSAEHFSPEGSNDCPSAYPCALRAILRRSGAQLEDEMAYAEYPIAERGDNSAPHNFILSICHNDQNLDYA